MQHRKGCVSAVLIAAILVINLVEFMRAQLQLRKPLPKPETKLNLGGPSN
jgi:hypothetical protein